MPGGHFGAYQRGWACAGAQQSEGEARGVVGAEFGWRPRPAASYIGTMAIASQRHYVRAARGGARQVRRRGTERRGVACGSRIASQPSRRGRGHRPSPPVTDCHASDASRGEAGRVRAWGGDGAGHAWVGLKARESAQLGGFPLFHFYFLWNSFLNWFQMQVWATCRQFQKVIKKQKLFKIKFSTSLL